MFNIGAANFKSSTLLKKLNQGDYEGAAAQFAVWNKSAGEVVAGLTARRATEAALFRSQSVDAGKDKPCGRATGDIHVETFDGVHYNFQAAGEFVALTDADGQVVVQLRLEPSHGLRGITVGTAVAARVDGATVAIHIKPNRQLYIDGQPVGPELGQGMQLGNAGGIIFRGNSYVIAWPDGTVASVWTSSRWVDLLVRPGSSGGKLVGLLGNADGKPEGDLATRDGLVLPAQISFKELHGRFAESWRISQAESLFHYAGGESTATYTDHSIPSGDVTVNSLDPAARAEAERLCRAAGITAPGPFEDCVLDLAVTGDRGFLSSAALAQAAKLEGIPSPSGTTTPAVQAGSLIVSGTGKEGYYVFDEAGKSRLTLERPTNSATELLPGTYTVALNNSRQRVAVTPGQQSVVQAGSLIVSGTGKEGYYVFDEAGKSRLTLERPTNSATELLPGTYVVKVGGRSFTVSVKAGQPTTVTPEVP